MTAIVSNWSDKNKCTWYCVDYDGCGDVARTFTGDKAIYEKWVSPVRAALISHMLQQVGNTEPILACGSARQSIVLNHYNRLENNNGCAYTELESLATRLNFGLYKGLLEDDVREVPDGTTWDKARKGDPGNPAPSVEAHGDLNIKVEILKKHVKEFARRGGTYFHFYDDRQDLLSGLAREVPILQRRYNVEIHLWEWDWTDRLNQQLELAHAGKELTEVRGPVKVE